MAQHFSEIKFKTIEELEAHFPAKGLDTLAYTYAADNFIKDENNSESDRVKAIKLAHEHKFIENGLGDLPDELAIQRWFDIKKKLRQDTVDLLGEQNAHRVLKD